MDKFKDFLPLIIIIVIVIGLLIYAIISNKLELAMFGATVAIGSFIVRKFIRK